MCYLVREQHAAAAEGGPATLPPDTGRLRPRWAGAAAAAVIGGLALAALVAPRSTASVPDVQPGAAAAVTGTGMHPVAARTTHLPDSAGGGNTSLPMDDGVPTPMADAPRAGLGHCNHGM